MEDSKIIELYWLRDESAIHATSQKYGAYLFKIAYNILADSQDSEESVNDTYLKAWNSMPPHRPDLLAAFLGKITRELSIDRLRWHTRQKRAASSVSLFAAGGMTGAANGLQAAPVRSYSVTTNDVVSLIGNGDNFSPMQERDYAKSSFRHHLPLSFGLSFRKEFAYGLSLDCGLNYTLLRSEVRLPYSSEEVSQTLHFVGVPLRLNWRFVERGAFSAYLGAGGMVEKCVAARLGSESVGEEELQWSLAAALGAQYRLGNHVALYFEPEVSCYLTDTELRTSRTDTSPTLTLRLGMRFAF